MFQFNPDEVHSRIKSWKRVYVYICICGGGRNSLKICRTKIWIRWLTMCACTFPEIASNFAWQTGMLFTLPQHSFHTKKLLCPPPVLRAFFNTSSVPVDVAIRISDYNVLMDLPVYTDLRWVTLGCALEGLFNPQSTTFEWRTATCCRYNRCIEKGGPE